MRYMLLTCTIPNRAHDGRKKYGSDTVKIFREGTHWQVTEDESMSVLCYEQEQIGPRHPNYHDIKNALVDREPTIFEMLDVLAVTAEEVLEHLPKADVLAAARDVRQAYDDAIQAKKT